MLKWSNTQGRVCCRKRTISKGETTATDYKYYYSVINKVHTTHNSYVKKGTWGKVTKFCPEWAALVNSLRHNILTLRGILSYSCQQRLENTDDLVPELVKQ